MSLIVLLEPELRRVDHLGSSGEQYVEGVRAVHAAASDPSGAGGPGDHTLCGADTRRMQTVDYRPTAPGSPWYPPKWDGTGRVCRDCDRAVRSA
ncbi:hypothetical protein ACFVHB_36225 [Kitasatospora sp. NPDC127111]|uniref:hypothetical protein n=1 Tax=Kitasatospora sp. NPDC127111 TaxID=3345363 RepID=UPI00364378BB